MRPTGLPEPFGGMMGIPANGLLPGARGLSRLPPLARPGQLAAVELVVLLLLGVSAALATTFLKVPLRIPGSAIVFSIFPTAFGVALVRRRAAGTVISASALATLAALRLAGTVTPGAGATASLLLTGPSLDVVLAAARSGWPLYAGFVLAGLLANLAAFLARAGVFAAGPHPGRALGAGGGAGLGGGLGGGAGHHLGHALGGAGAMGGLGLRHALLTYAACGVAAGLLSAVAWFHFREQPDARGAGRP